mmetsp:Transcript_12830/g.19327  ORF Transcript_12830/g.19327 Transcript_12830/m.19327 type:complete len:145 (+) Transcript_12830:35-469(+)
MIRRIQIKRCIKTHTIIKREFQKSKNPVANPEITKDTLKNYQRKLLLNARYRGRVETELFLGGWAVNNIWKLSLEECEKFEELLEYPDNELYEWFIGQEEPVEEVAKNPYFNIVKEYIEAGRHLLNEQYNQSVAGGGGGGTTTL